VSAAERIPLAVVGDQAPLVTGADPVSEPGGVGGAGTEVVGFLRDLVDQLRAGDAYGQFERLPDERMLAPFVLTREERRAIPVDGDVQPATESRLRSFYQAVSAGIEKASGEVTSYVLDLSHEGFGRVVVFTGRLVALSDVLRDAHRFGFDSLDQLRERGERLVEQAGRAIETYPEVARDDG